MRRTLARTLLGAETILVLAVSWTADFFVPSTFALDIQQEVQKMEDQVALDWNAAQSFTCGGLLSATDERVLAYYMRRELLECGFPPFAGAKTPSPSEWCTQYDKNTGACIGKKCTLVRQRGVPDRTILSECDASGSCTTPNPHQSCNFPYYQSTKRVYECAGASAECYTYLPNLRYSQSYYPFAYNCVVSYDPSTLASDEPKGQLSLIPPYTLPPLTRRGEDVWEPAPASNITVPSAPLMDEGADGNLRALRLDSAALRAVQNVIHPTVQVGTRLTQYPDLRAFIGELAQPPEVRLILPAGGLSLQHRFSQFFGKIFSSLQSPHTPTTIMLTLGNNPEALTVAASYLEEVPFFTVRYEPLHIQTPFASAQQLRQIALEWKTWIREVEETGVTMDATLKARIENDVIAILESYSALQDSIREYRLHFPQYLDALLSYLEKANDFFQKHWLAENRRRLQEWQKAYANYLPALQNKLKTLSTAASKYTAECLVPACRLDTIPVKDGIKPWNLVPEDSDLVFGGADNAWLPEGPRAWEEVQGQVVQWHPLQLIGSPLPDITLDFSEILQAHPITVPVLQVEWLPLSLPYPPGVNTENLPETLASLERNLQPLPRLHPPLGKPSFPPLRLPDPRTSLLLVPEPPPLPVLGTWTKALAWRGDRLQDLLSTCDTSPQPLHFLVHEFNLYGSKEDPTIYRSAAFVPGETPQIRLSPVWYGLGIFDTSGLPGGVRLPPLLAPPICADCGTVRTQRFIRQHVEFDHAWESLQENFLSAIDTWNAQARYFSVVARDELERPDLEQFPSLP